MRHTSQRSTRHLHTTSPTARPRRLTRRWLAALTLALAVPWALAACGGAGEASASGETRVVTDAEGTRVEVPVAPERVVALSEPTLDGMLALGVTPAGTVTGRGQSTVPHYLADRAGDVPLLGGVAQPNFEKIATADPDLILVDGTSINNNPEAIEVLRRIAPVVVCGYAGGDWRATFGQVSEALNLAAEGQAVVADYDRAVAAARTKLSRYAEDTFSIVRWQGNSASLILKELPAGIALSDLGLKRPPVQDRKGRGHSEPVSLENLDQIDADHLFFGTLGGSSNANPNAGGTSDTTGAEKALAEAEKVAGFTDLVAYRTQQIHPVDGSRWTSTGGPLLMRGLVDDLVEVLA